MSQFSEKGAGSNCDVRTGTFLKWCCGAVASLPARSFGLEVSISKFANRNIRHSFRVGSFGIK